MIARADEHCGLARRLLAELDWNRTVASVTTPGNAQAAMSLTYVIPDIHGRYDLLGRALADIAAHSGGEAGVIVTIGDYVDKGPDSRQVIDRLLPGIAGGWRFVALKGNHDAMMVRGAARSRRRWRRGWRRAAMRRWPPMAAIPPPCRRPTSPGSISLPLMHVDAHRLYVHAGVDPDVPLDRQSEATLLWKRYPKGYPGGFGGSPRRSRPRQLSRRPAAVRRPHQSGHAGLAHGTADGRNFRRRPSRAVPSILSWSGDRRPGLTCALA